MRRRRRSIKTTQRQAEGPGHEKQLEPRGEHLDTAGLRWQ